MSRTADARHDLAQQLGVALPGWSVYAEPPAGVHVPAVAFGPGEPYRRSVAYRVDDVRLRLAVLVSEGSDLALDQLDESLDTVLDALRSVPICAVESVGQVGQVQEVGGVGYLAAFVDITLGIERT